MAQEPLKKKRSRSLGVEVEGSLISKTQAARLQLPTSSWKSIRPIPTDPLHIQGNSRSQWRIAKSKRAREVRFIRKNRNKRILLLNSYSPSRKTWSYLRRLLVQHDSWLKREAVPSHYPPGNLAEWGAIARHIRSKMREWRLQALNQRRIKRTERRWIRLSRSLIRSLLSRKKRALIHLPILNLLL